MEKLITKEKLEALSHSKFRSQFHLNRNMKNYAKEKGSELISQHAYDFINKRLRPAHIENDGKQTPTRRNSHPVFLAQHACACCCRGCLEKWHHIPKGRELTDEEVDEIVKLLMMWINAELKRQDSK
ncbi:protein of unknown function [Kandleria vitulina]|jgi:exodeoxyribonuclease V alpha subunit|uniref:DUF4186 domain-containing protein n=1 Tax=Kandleria vitulina TaxID=1630 RepID=A0A1H2QXV8_9FIRM|nr:DUF4186 domain-containing protein [Kandleria vitulina]SDW11464.1 protein of unknown function [Kandleria vitulina]